MSSLAARDTLTNSASVVDFVIFSWRFILQSTAPPSSLTNLAFSALHRGLVVSEGRGARFKRYNVGSSLGPIARYIIARHHNVRYIYKVLHSRCNLDEFYPGCVISQGRLRKVIISFGLNLVQVERLTGDNGRAGRVDVQALSCIILVVWR